MTIVYKPRGRAGEYADWALNLYRGCGHGCTYCYAPRVVRMDRCQFHDKPEPRKDILGRLYWECQTGVNAGKQVLLCFTTDPYQPIEKELLITRNAIKILHDGGANVTILTKAPSLALRDRDILWAGSDEIATTLTFDSRNWEKSLEWEPKAELPHQRQLALQKFHGLGFRTWASLEPVIDPQATIDVILETHRFVDLYKVGKLNYVQSDIDWGAFAVETITMLQRLGKEYLVKEDLKEYL